MSKLNKQVICDADVKQIATKFLRHKKCTTKTERKYASKVTGKYLNDYLVEKKLFDDVIKEGYTTKPFNSRKKYSICSNLKRGIEQQKKSFCSSVHATTPPCLEDCTPAPSQIPRENGLTKLPSREERLFLRNRIPVKSLKGIKKINLKISGDDDVVISTKKFSSTKGLSYSNIYHQDVLHESKKYKIPLGKLVMKQKQIRTSDLSKKLLAACINRREYKKLGPEYLKNNEELAIDIINLLDYMKSTIQSKLKLKFIELEDAPIASVPNDNQGLIATLDKNKQTHKLAIALLSGSSLKGYERMRFNMETFVSLPSYFVLTKGRPPIFGFEYKVTALNENNLVPNKDQRTEEGDTLLGLITQDSNEAEQLEFVMRKTSNTGGSFDAASIDGGYSKYIDLLESNHSKYGREIRSNQNVLVIDSIDGAEHTRSNKKMSSIISFSSTLIVPEWINNKEVSAGSSLNILTWQQVQAVENLPTILTSTAKYFEQKMNVRKDIHNDKRKTYHYYDLHDGKMLYLLTQHSAWNRKEHPFLLCECRRGEGVRNNNKHECKLISYEDQISLYERSEISLVNTKINQKGKEMNTAKKITGIGWMIRTRECHIMGFIHLSYQEIKYGLTLFT